MPFNVEFRARQFGRAKIFPVLMLALLAGSAGAWLAVQSSRPATDDLQALQESLQNSIVFPENYRQVPEFTLTNQHGMPITEKDLQGRWNLIFFGFTHCPDVCPLTMTVVRSAYEELQQQAAVPTPQIVFVSVDPKRDTVEHLKNYLDFFNPEFVGVTGELNDILALTRPLSIVVQFVANDENPENYNVDHTASILLVDPDLRVRGSLKSPHEKDTIIADYTRLVAALAGHGDS